MSYVEHFGQSVLDKTRDCFVSLDTDKDSFLSIADFKTYLENIKPHIKNLDYQHACIRLKLVKKDKLSYSDFLNFYNIKKYFVI